MAILCLTCVASQAQDTITWNSSINAVNRSSSDALMDGGFRFQLGVFQGTFVPTPSNTAQWTANWVSAGHTAYLESTARFADNLSVLSNAPPFTAGKAAYIWGFRGDASSSEWILFRATSWNWPAVNPGAPVNFTWRARDATPILGQINSGGSPFLMKSVAITNLAPPTTSWDQWVATELAGVSQNGPNDDPDHDGTPNLLEFVFGTSPTTPNTPTPTPLARVDGHLVITLPRRIDHPATLSVEVSSDLVNWNSGPEQTEILSNGLTSLQVRDLTPLDPAHPKRFIRLRATLP